MKISVIARIENDYKTKFGIPRQSGLNSGIISRIVFEKEYRVREAFFGLESFSHMWILWGFSQCEDSEWKPTVRPPVLGGNKRMGVFSTRSPFRPNHIGMSAVKIEKISYDEKDSPVIYVSGADIMNGTPIYDIKPYIPYADCIADASGGFSDAGENTRCEIIYDKDVPEGVRPDVFENIVNTLSLNPCPRYVDDKNRIFGMEFSDYEVKFRLIDNKIKIISIQ